MNVKLITPIPPVTNLDEEEDGRAMFQLVQDWNIYVDGIMWTFKDGLKTDFASIPRLFWRLYNPTDIHLQAASFLHDQIYRAGGPRGWADDALRAIAEARGMNKVQSNIIWSAVRIGGKHAWDKNSDELKRQTRALIYHDGKQMPVTGWIK